MTIKDEYGYEYHPIEEFDLGARNDFTLDELVEAVNGGEEIFVDYLYPERDHDGKGYSKTETHDDGRPMYIGYRDFNQPPIGYRLVEGESLSYESGVIKGFGTFQMIDNGNLGDGHEAWALLEHVESGRLFRNGGWYSSWDSGEMDEWVEVVPAEVKVVRYKDINSDKIFDNPAVTVS